MDELFYNLLAVNRERNNLKQKIVHYLLAHLVFESIGPLEAPLPLLVLIIIPISLSKLQLTASHLRKIQHDDAPTKEVILIQKQWFIYCYTLPSEII